MAPETRDERPDSALEELFHRAERVTLVDWRSFSGAKSTVLLLAAIAGLAFISGLSDLSQQTIRLDGPLGTFFPGESSLIRLYGVFFSFLLAALTVGMQRRKSLAWYAVMVALPLLSLLPLVTAEPNDLPLLLLTLVAYPLLIWNRNRFDQTIDLSPFQTAALAAFVGVQIYGVIGSYVMREQFTGIKSFSDAFYYIIVTGTTVGYGDATPTTQLTKLFVVSVIVLATGAFTLASGSLLIPAIESRISSAFGNMTASQLTLLEDHVLVLGHGDMTEPLLEELGDDTDLVVVTDDTDATSDLRDDGYNVLTADPTDEESLLDARIDQASGVVVATEDDANDVLAVLAARQANPDVRIVAAAQNQNNISKLEGVGADRVISPTVIGGRMLGRSVLEGEATLFPDEEGEDAEVEVEVDADATGGTEESESDADPGADS